MLPEVRRSQPPPKRQIGFLGYPAPQRKQVGTTRFPTLLFLLTGLPGCLQKGWAANLSLHYPDSTLSPSALSCSPMAHPALAPLVAHSTKHPPSSQQWSDTPALWKQSEELSTRAAKSSANPDLSEGLSLGEEPPGKVHTISGRASTALQINC